MGREKKRTSNVDFGVKNVRGQWLDAGFKISSANGGLSPAKEDVICRLRVISMPVVITRAQRERGEVR